MQIQVWIICIVFMCLGIFQVIGDEASKRNFVVTNGNVTCVVMTATLVFDIPYSTGTKNTSILIEVPDNATVNGTCDDSSGTNIINIYFYNSTLTLSVVIKKSSSNLTTHWDYVTLRYRIDESYFPPADKQIVGNEFVSTTHLANDTFQQATSCANTTFSPQSFPLDGGVTLSITNLRYRAFGTSNSKSLLEENTCEGEGNGDPIPETNLTLAVTVGIALAVTIVVAVLFYVIVSRVKKLD